VCVSEDLGHPEGVGCPSYCPNRYTKESRQSRQKSRQNVWVEFRERNQRVYYESIKREPKRRGINKCRCDERLQTKTKEFTRLPYTGFLCVCFIEECGPGVGVGAHPSENYREDLYVSIGASERLINVGQT